MEKETANQSSLDEEIRAFRRGKEAFNEGQTRHFNPYLSESEHLAEYWSMGWDMRFAERTYKYTPLEETNAWEPLSRDE